MYCQVVCKRKAVWASVGGVLRCKQSMLNAAWGNRFDSGKADSIGGESTGDYLACSEGTLCGSVLDRWRFFRASRRGPYSWLLWTQVKRSYLVFEHDWRRFEETAKRASFGWRKATDGNSSTILWSTVFLVSVFGSGCSLGVCSPFRLLCLFVLSVLQTEWVP